MYKNLSYMSLILETDILNLTTVKKKDVKYKISLLEGFNEDWKVNFIKDLLGCLDDCSFGADHKNFKNILEYLCVST